MLNIEKYNCLLTVSIQTGDSKYLIVVVHRLQYFIVVIVHRLQYSVVVIVNRLSTILYTCNGTQAKTKILIKVLTILYTS